MQSHNSGQVYSGRNGAIKTAQTWKFASGGITSGSNTKLCTIPANTADPVLYRVQLVEVSANTAAGAVTASIGTASAGTQILNAVDLKATAGTVYTHTNALNYITADTDIWLNYTVASGTDAAMVFVVVVEPIEVNVAAV